MIEEFLNRIEIGQAKVVDNEQPYFSKVYNTLPDYVIKEMKKNLSKENITFESKPLKYGFFPLKDEPIELRDWLKLSYIRDGGNSANKGHFKIFKFTENNQLRYAINGSYGVYFYDENFNLLKSYKNSGYSRDCYIDIFDDFMVMVQDHKIIGLKYSTFEKLWEFGTGRAGYFDTNQIYYCRSVAKAPNGNFIFAQIDGKGYDKINNEFLTSKNEGVVFELTPKGEFVKTILYRKENTYYPEQNAIKNPHAMKIVDNKLYISTYYNLIAVFELDENNNATYITSLTPPPEFGITFDINIKEFLINNNELIIVSEALKKIIGFDLETRKITFYVGDFSIENMATSKPKINGLCNIKGIALAPDNINFLISDDFNDMVKLIYRNKLIFKSYDIPENIEIIYSSFPFNKEKNKFQVDINNSEDVFLVYKETI